MVVNDDVKKKYLALANMVARLYKAILPDPLANTYSTLVALFIVTAREILSYIPQADISDFMDDTAKLLDISVATRGYVIREASVAYGDEAHVDLSQVDFDALKARFEHARKHIELEKLRGAISSKLKRMLQLNKSRANYQERFQRLIDEYNAGSANAEFFLDKLVAFTQELNAEDQRHVAEHVSEEELAVFDLLTHPDMQLSEKERNQVKLVACELLTTLKREKLVLDWRKKQRARAQVVLTIRATLDDGLPRSYTPALYQKKCDEVYQHIYDSYYGQGQSLYAAAS